MKKLEANFKNGEKVALLGGGEIQGRDGRSYSIDLNKLLETIKSNGLDIPLDENHSLGQALGWLSEFEIKDNTLWARLDLNDDGKDLVEKKKYKYLSPVLDTLGKNVVGLDSVALVNRPNLKSIALNNKEIQKNQKEADMPEEIKKIEERLTELSKGLELVASKLNALTVSQDNVKKEANSMPSAKLDELASGLKALEKAFGIFGKTTLANNAKKALDADEARVAKILGLSEEEYIQAKGE